MDYGKMLADDYAAMDWEMTNDFVITPYAPYANAVYPDAEAWRGASNAQIDHANGGRIMEVIDGDYRAVGRAMMLASPDGDVTDHTKLDSTSEVYMYVRSNGELVATLEVERDPDEDWFDMITRFRRIENDMLKRCFGPKAFIAPGLRLNKPPSTQQSVPYAELMEVPSWAQVEKEELP